ncbi:MAG: hypothetical protein H7222_05280 [Methylotenera sp.]|nr:hypothetical protein [Oligoflexia bacterium]
MKLPHLAHLSALSSKLVATLFATTLTLASIPALALGFVSTAHADTSRGEALQNQGIRLKSVERQLALQDQQILDYYLAAIDSVLSRYPSPMPSASFMCISDGQSGPFERFTLTNTATGATLGNPTTLDTCRKLLLVQKYDLICLSNGENGPFEKFAPYDTVLGKFLGGPTAFKTCQTMVTRSEPSLLCTSNGEGGPFEKLSLYNRKLDRAIGGGTQLEQCLSTISQ